MTWFLAWFVAGAGCFRPAEVCEPDCTGRDCGRDPRCGLSCGACEGALVCGSTGLCVPAAGDEDEPEPAGDGDGGPDATDGGGAHEEAAGDDGDGADPDPCDNPELECRMPQARTPIAQGEDTDGDGWGDCCDCAPGDATKHPWRMEVANGEDDNCNELVDEKGGYMVRVSFYENIWIDAFETTVFDTAGCAGVRYGEGADDYPPEWPADATSPPGVTLFACSLPDVQPSGHLSWYRARWACEAQGKRLCTSNEWGEACSAQDTLQFPYGVGFEPGTCNEGWSGPGTVAPTAAFPRCVSGYGVFDMVGNLSEWRRNWDTPDHPDNALTAGFSYVCEFCRHGEDCVPCDLDDPTHVGLFDDAADCLAYARDFESFPRAETKVYFGARCCYEKQ